MNKKIDWRIVVTAIIAITILECVALFNGINGTYFSIVLAILAGLAGYILPSPIGTK